MTMGFFGSRLGDGGEQVSGPIGRMIVEIGAVSIITLAWTMLFPPLGILFGIAVAVPVAFTAIRRFRRRHRDEDGADQLSDAHPRIT